MHPYFSRTHNRADIAIFLKCFAFVLSAAFVLSNASAQLLLLKPTHLSHVASGTAFVLQSSQESSKFAALVPFKLPLPQFIDDDNKTRFKKSAAGGEIFTFKRLVEAKNPEDGKPSGIMTAVFEHAGKEWVGVLETPAADLKAQTAGQGTSVPGLMPQSQFAQAKQALEGKRLYSYNCGWWEMLGTKFEQADTPSMTWVTVSKVSLSAENDEALRVWFKAEAKGGKEFFMDLNPYISEGSYALSNCLRNKAI